MKGLENAEELSVTPDVWQCKQIIEAAHSAEPGSFMIDAGCHHGVWMRTGTGRVPGTKSVGVDLINHGVSGLYDYFFEVALDVEEKIREVTIFKESALNSLYPRNENLCFDNWPHADGAYQITRPSRRLDSILDEIGGVDCVHYVKVDCQANDLNVALSLGSYLDRTNYIQLECSMSERFLYETGTTYLEDIAALDKVGFYPMYYVRHGSPPLGDDSPEEGDILYGRKS